MHMTRQGLRPMRGPGEKEHVSLPSSLMYYYYNVIPLISYIHFILHF